MLKQDLEKELEKLRKEKVETKKLLQKVCKEAIENNCSDAVPYVAEITEKLGVDVNCDWYVNLNVQLPVHVINKWLESELDETDFELKVCGKTVGVVGIGDMDSN